MLDLPVFGEGYASDVSRVAWEVGYICSLLQVPDLDNAATQQYEREKYITDYNPNKLMCPIIYQGILILWHIQAPLQVNGGQEFKTTLAISHHATVDV